jgi:hypothetical protein
MSACNNNRLATFELTEFNRNPQKVLTRNNKVSVQTKNLNKEKIQQDYTDFNYADFVSCAKSSTEKPFNQPQINADKPQRVDRQQRDDNEWFDYAAFITLTKSKIVQN